MAIKERLLRELFAIENRLTHTSDVTDRVAKNSILQQLTIIRDLCCDGLPKEHWGNYVEIYDGMILAFKQMSKIESEAERAEIRSLIADILQKLVQQTKNENNFKKEIVFLPYKASMWDSLESVWQAATEDTEHCKAYVMPIPYADRNPDGSAAAWHYEGAEFPQNVPILDCNKIDLNEMRPDMIFIHNCYDANNLVTSVDERFYSTNLKNCTDKLVYIPYFVLGEIDPDNEEAVKGIQHFVLTPGVLNSDLVIVQSEKMREAYINVLIKNTNVSDRAFWEKRILGLGSPKLDKVAHAERKDFRLPKAWKKLLKGKKAVLYNTSLSSMLKYTENYCKKIRSVLATFKKQKDIVLWWRPHPLMEATFRSMHPELLKEYEKIVKDYKKAGWGIFDDTAELTRSIVWTDGYYGDWSSVVQLYEATGKTIMIQNVESYE